MGAHVHPRIDIVETWGQHVRQLTAVAWLRQ